MPLLAMFHVEQTSVHPHIERTSGRGFDSPQPASWSTHFPVPVRRMSSNLLRIQAAFNVVRARVPRY